MGKDSSIKSKDKKDLKKRDWSKRRNTPVTVYVLFVAMYMATNYFTTVVAGSGGGVITLFKIPIPIMVFLGVLSSLANMCLIFLVVFFNKIGFFTSLILLAAQFPILLLHFTRDHSPNSIPGMFSNVFTIISIILIYRRNKKIDEYQNMEVDYLKKQQKFSQRLFEQTATALVNAIDANDTYSHGHSLRVAEYSERIARVLGKDEEECRKIYYAALLHDVGKIGIPNDIINKKGRLTEEEFEIIKQHPVMGNQILSSIGEYPYLSIGAHYHHERYDGRGYPEKLKGEDIPEIARIISVADAYDAMTSNRSYRDAIPQQIVREEIIKGAGTQFDPEFARIMQHLIDTDVEYQMKERKAVNELAGKNELECVEYRSEISDGIQLTDCPTKIRLKLSSDRPRDKRRGAALIMFDSLDGRVHDDEKTIRELNYFEYCEIRFDGHVSESGARKVLTKRTEYENGTDEKIAQTNPVSYEIEAVKYKDHVLIKIDDKEVATEVTVALPDSSRFAYISLTGEHCHIGDVSVDKEDRPITKDYIPRIAEEISYIDRIEGDIPNVQIDGHRTASTAGILLKNRLMLSFHTMSLPTSRLVWHCPYIVIFSSKDGRVNGADYREYALIRLDGENIDTSDESRNTLNVDKKNEFAGWDEWKISNKKGVDCIVYFERKGNIINMNTENLGVLVRNTTEILDGAKNVYVALTGDQCALTDIRIEEKD